MRVICQDCKQEIELDARRFRCDCGGPWEALEIESFDVDMIRRDISSLWRYLHIFALGMVKSPVSLGAGWTPLISAEWAGRDTLFKLEYVSPTGSFKDRGVEVEISFLDAIGVRQIVEDSSGNAGAAAAAYAARAGISVHIYAPASASPNKLAQIEVYGAELHKIPGPRQEAANAALAAVQEGTVYASHVYHPVYLLGQQSFAWEIWEQTAGNLPDALVIPTGQGGQLLGAWFGFNRMLRAGVITKMPHLYAAQSEFVAPIHHAVTNRLDDIQEVTPSGTSAADGIAIAKPVRGKRILQALRESGGGAVAVSEKEIHRACKDLAKRGMFVEPTSAVAAAAVSKVRGEIGDGALILAALTGSGMKTPLLKE